MSAPTSSLEPILLYGGVLGPNPPKVGLLLSSLGLPYTPVLIPINKVKDPSYTRINPNGRLPSIIDPNSGLTIWETGAILDYLVAQYDTSFEFSFDVKTEKTEYYEAKSWLHFQTSGQGPFYGQVFYFKHLFATKPQDVIDRYISEARRVTGVLEKRLSEDGREWLVGNRCSYVDFAWLPWQKCLEDWLVREEKGWDTQTEFPLVWAWMERVLGREKVAEVWEERRVGMIAARQAMAEEAAEQEKKGDSK